MCTFTVISDECIKASLFVSESQVLIFMRWRLQPCRTGGICTAILSPSELPNSPTTLSPSLHFRKGKTECLFPQQISGVMPVVENETGRLVWWTVPEVSGILCGVPVLQGVQEMGYLRVNCCFYWPWLPKGAAGVLVWTLPSSPLSVVLFIWLVSGSEL